jgi:triphosphoribosyl-dephospho-CoA synthase
MSVRLDPGVTVPADLAALFIAACQLDVLASKPGNVSVASPGHGMVAADFLASATAAAPHVVDGRLAPGERIHRAIDATRAAVACNTNLGIVLLAVPLICAAQRRLPGEDMTGALQATLAGLDRRDADWAFRAIRLAAPAGLGRSPRHDVEQPATVSLLAAMREAASRDRIARQYAHGYADVLGLGLSSLRRARRQGMDDCAALVHVYLDFLCAFPDSHVLRKHGFAAAELTRHQASQCRARIVRHPALAQAALAELDQRFKSAGINPGSSADLCVATLLADRLQTQISWPAAARPGDGGPLHSHRVEAIQGE